MSLFHPILYSTTFYFHYIILSFLSLQTLPSGIIKNLFSYSFTFIFLFNNTRMRIRAMHM